MRCQTNAKQMPTRFQPDSNQIPHKMPKRCRIGDMSHIHACPMEYSGIPSLLCQIMAAEGKTNHTAAVLAHHKPGPSPKSRIHRPVAPHDALKFHRASAYVTAALICICISAFQQRPRPMSAMVSTWLLSWVLLHSGVRCHCCMWVIKHMPGRCRTHRCRAEIYIDGRAKLGTTEANGGPGLAAPPLLSRGFVLARPLRYNRRGGMGGFQRLSDVPVQQSLR